MTDGEARRGGPWPLLAMTVLVLLLAVFLLIRWSRRDAGPAVVKEPVPPPVPARPASVEKLPEPTPPPPPVKDPKEETYKAKVGEAGEAFRAGHWNDAEAAIKAAQELFDRPELKALAEAVRKARDDEAAQAKAEAEARRNQEKGWVETRDRVEKAREKSFYDEAAAALEGLARDFPKVLGDQRYLDLAKQVKDLRDETLKVYTQLMADAQKAFSEERFAPAILAARQAGDLYPERRPAVKEFQERVNDVLLRKTMVRVACNTPATIGGDLVPDEKPVRPVTLPPFYIDKYEVTNEDYFAFATATNHPAPPYWVRRKPPAGREKHPVTFVTYADAEAYAKWAGKRLPTAEEWEVAARGPDAREFPWGAAFNEKENVFHCNCLEYWQVTKNPPGTLAVDAFDAANSASFYGVYGMGGNAWEWTSTPVERKVAGKDEVFRVLKGGSFMTPARAIRSANVYVEDPTLGQPDVGFRCVRDVK